MSIFQNLRTRAIKQKWDAFFERSGKFASAFVDTTKLLDFEAVTVARLPGDRGLIEHHGSIDAVGKALRHELVSLGIMQDGPGAPKGNQNAVGAVHDEKAKTEKPKSKPRLGQKAWQPPRIKAPKSEIVGLAETKVQTAIDRVVESTKALDVVLNPTRTVTLQSTTKLVDGKLSTSVAKTKNAIVAKDAAKPKRSHHKKLTLAEKTARFEASEGHKTKPAKRLISAMKKHTKRSHHKKKAA